MGKSTQAENKTESEMAAAEIQDHKDEENGVTEENGVDGKSLALTTELVPYKGQLLPMSPYLVSEERLHYMENFTDLRDDDIFVASFPKSGTHWVMDIATKILFDGNLAKAETWARPALEFEVKPFSDGRHQVAVGVEGMASLPSPRVIYTHLWYQNLPDMIREKNAKIIYVHRNVKDCWVSQFLMVNKTLPADMNLPWDMYFDGAIDGTMPYGKWCDHYQSYYEQCKRSNILFLSYEEMQQDLNSTVLRMAKFLDKALPEDTIQRIVQSCTLEATLKATGSSDFVNKGIVGGWKGYFSASQAEMCDQRESYTAAVKMNGKAHKNNGFDHLNGSANNHVSN